FMREAGIDQYLLENDALRREQLQKKLLRALEIGLRKPVRAEPVLIGHHHQLVTGGNAAAQGRDHVRQQGQLVQTVDLFVGRFLDQTAIAIQEKKFACHALSFVDTCLWAVSVEGS